MEKYSIHSAIHESSPCSFLKGSHVSKMGHTTLCVRCHWHCAVSSLLDAVERSQEIRIESLGCDFFALFSFLFVPSPLLESLFPIQIQKPGTRSLDETLEKQRPRGFIFAFGNQRILSLEQNIACGTPGPYIWRTARPDEGDAHLSKVGQLLSNGLRCQNRSLLMGLMNSVSNLIFGLIAISF